MIRYHTNMNKFIKFLTFPILFGIHQASFAYPAQAELFGLSESMVHVWVT